MKLRSITAAAAGALASTLLVAAPSSATPADVEMTFDSWIPATAACTQVIGFSLLPGESDTVPPTGSVSLTEGGATIGTVPVEGFGSYTLTSRCADDDTARMVVLVYSGDAAHARRVTTSPGACSSQLIVPTQLTWEMSGGTGPVQPVYWCHTNTAAWMRSTDGRLFAGIGYSGGRPPEVRYGERLSYDIGAGAYAPADPAGLTGTFTVSVDGATQRTLSVTTPTHDWDFTWHVDTSRLRVGAHRLYVRYSGSSRYMPATVAIDTIPVIKAPTDLRAVAKREVVPLGQRPVISLTVRNALNPHAPAPTGKVTIYFDGKRAAQAALRLTDRGRRTLTLPPIRKRGPYGWHAIKVVFAGNDVYEGASFDRLDVVDRSK